MNLSELKQAFAQPGDPGIIDLVMPDGRGAYSHETLELGVLPPVRWIRRGREESFEMLERTYGEIRLCAVRFEGRCYAWFEVTR